MNNITENNINKIISVEENRISNFNELLAFIRKYNDLCEKYKNSSKIEKGIIRKDIGSILNILRRGIKINNAIILQYIENIREFLNMFKINDGLIVAKLNSLELTISPVKLLENGKLCNYGSFIAIDYEYINFDENGNFLSFKEPIPGFFRHTIIHELLHAISNKGFNYLDSFSEGMTDYFAHKISKANNFFSNKYGYIERIFYMFGVIMGDDLLFEDYVTDLGKMKNLHVFIESLGISDEEFKSFKTDMDIFLKMKFEKRDNNEELMIQKKKIDNFVFIRILMPYCSNDKCNAIKMMERFFSDSDEVKLDLCEIHTNSCDRKVKN